MATYSKGSRKDVKDAMHEMKHGQLKTGTGKKVTSPKQAIAIGLSEAREEGKKVPAKKKSASAKRTSNAGATKKSASKQGTTKKSAAKKSTTKRSSTKKSTTKKSSTKKSAAKKSSGKKTATK